jgi:hypothetical protein
MPSQKPRKNGRDGYVQDGIRRGDATFGKEGEG